MMRDIFKHPASMEQRTGYYYAGDLKDEAGCGISPVSFESTDADRAAKFVLFEQLAAALRLVTIREKSLPFQHKCHKFGPLPRSEYFCANGSRTLLEHLSPHRLTDVQWDAVNRRGRATLDGLIIGIRTRRVTGAVARLDIYDVPVMPG